MLVLKFSHTSVVRINGAYWYHMYFRIMNSYHEQISFLIDRSFTVFVHLTSQMKELKQTEVQFFRKPMNHKPLSFRKKNQKY